MSPANQLDGLEIKLRQLAAKVDRQQAQHAAVVSENERLQRELDRQSGMVDTLRDKLSRATGAEETEDQQVPAQYQDTLAYCLQEIDRCLDWLKRN